MKLSNKVYDILNFIVRALLPLADLVLALATIWGLPYGKEINATIIAIHAFLAIFVTGANASYKKNSVTKTEAELDAMLESTKE